MNKIFSQKKSQTKILLDIKEKYNFEQNPNESIYKYSVCALSLYESEERNIYTLVLGKTAAEQKKTVCVPTLQKKPIFTVNNLLSSYWLLAYI